MKSSTQRRARNNIGLFTNLLTFLFLLVLSILIDAAEVLQLPKRLFIVFSMVQIVLEVGTTFKHSKTI